jgi:tRNA_anti-like
MKTQKNPVTLLIIFGLWLGLVLGCSSLRKAMESKRIEREGTGITISAEDLYKAYESNEAEADKLYQGKIVIVTGKVGIIDAKIPVVFLMDARQKANIQCGFTADQKDAVSKLEFRQTVTVKGKCAGKVLGSVGLTDCVLQ